MWPQRQRDTLVACHLFKVHTTSHHTVLGRQGFRAHLPTFLVVIFRQRLRRTDLRDLRFKAPLLPATQHRKVHPKIAGLIDGEGTLILPEDLRYWHGGRAQPPETFPPTNDYSKATSNAPRALRQTGAVPPTQQLVCTLPDSPWPQPNIDASQLIPRWEPVKGSMHQEEGGASLPEDSGNPALAYTKPVVKVDGRRSTYYTGPGHGPGCALVGGLDTGTAVNANASARSGQ